MNNRVVNLLRRFGGGRSFERNRLAVPPVGGGPQSSVVEPQQKDFRPIHHFAMDIVDNCNLRCPFCLYDYQNTHRTNVMSDEVFDAAIRLIPFVGEGHFWLSCLHEPTMHPQFARFIERIPPEHRGNVFYTSNFARRMPAAYYDVIGRSGLAFINVSIESRDPTIYEHFRKGARYPIFMESWEQLLAACRAGTAPPKLRYIIMAYKSNMTEIPELIAYLREERDAAFIDVRYTYDEAHIDADFKRQEYLDASEWLWLKSALAQYPASELSVCPPPGLCDPAAHPANQGTEGSEDYAVTQGEYEFRVSWSGRLCVAPIYRANRPACVPDLLETNIANIEDPVQFFHALGSEAHRKTLLQ